MSIAARVVLLLLLGAPGCSIDRAGLGDQERPDGHAGGPEAGRSDAGDAGALDEMDAGGGDEMDAGARDGGAPDAGPPDSGQPDSRPPDTGPPDTGPPDTGPDWEELCRARYEAPGFILCWAMDGECGFNADTWIDGSSNDCNRYCGDRGGMCLDAHDNPNIAGMECNFTDVTSDDCRTDRGTELCVCSI